MDYHMMKEGVIPLFVEELGGYTNIEDWEFSDDLLTKLRRLNELWDKTINWANPKDEEWSVSEEDRAEYARLFPVVIEKIKDEIGPEWLLEVANVGRI